MPAVDAVAAVDEGRMSMMPPTYLTCLEVARHPTPSAVLAACADRDLEMFMPAVVDDGEGFTLSRPARLDPLIEEHFTRLPSELAGRSFGSRGRCVLAPNANMMTLDGTNTWVLREPDARRSVVVDPGPSIVAPRRGGGRGRRGGGGAADPPSPRSRRGRTGVRRAGGLRVRALDPAFRLGSEGLADGDVVEVDGLEVRVIGTPGHTADSLSFLVPAEDAVLTGDTVLGRGTTVVAHPDGRLGAYLDSLDRLHALASAHSCPRSGPATAR